MHLKVKGALLIYLIDYGDGKVAYPILLDMCFLWDRYAFIVGTSDAIYDIF